MQTQKNAISRKQFQLLQKVLIPTAGRQKIPIFWRRPLNVPTFLGLVVKNRRFQMTKLGLDKGLRSHLFPYSGHLLLKTVGTFQRLKLVDREVQNCELKKFSVFRIIFARWAHWEVSSPASSALWISLCAVAFPFLTAEEHTHTHPILGVNFGGKFGENTRFRCIYNAFFNTCLGEQLFASISEKCAQNPFCKRDPFKGCWHFFQNRNFH